MRKIIRLSELKKPPIEQYEKEMCKHKLFIKPQMFFDKYGLRHSFEHLDMIGGAIIMMPLEYMAEYVDIVTKTNIDEGDPIFLIHNILTLKVKKTDFSNFNATSIGNIAYVLLHCKSKDAQKIATNILESYKDYYLNI